MERYDAIIVGGGPAGSSCAWYLTRLGYDVLVLDKKMFPRDKVCAGWITPSVVDDLELPVDEYRRSFTLQPFTAFRTGIIGQEMMTTRYDCTVSYGIRRCEFDHYLLQRSGARLQPGVAAKQFVRRGGMWLVNDTWETPLLIGAGGHFCPVARLMGADVGKQELAVRAQEMEIKLTPAQLADTPVCAEVPELYFCPDLAGYGWVVRKGEYLNIGLGRESDVALSRHVSEFIDYLHFEGRIPRDIHARMSGHAYLLYQHAKREIIGDGVLLIGDAAGLAYTQSGEGIRPAVESGLMAARLIALLRGDYSVDALRAYEYALQKRFGQRSHKGIDSWVPMSLKRMIGEKLLHTAWFTRHVVLDRWFFHHEKPALNY
ncbi:MAG: NAD(P)/FAD-dependent oxidoreductase [Pseudomonadota bacterium]